MAVFSSRFAGLSAGRARLALLALVLLIASGVMASGFAAMNAASAVRFDGTGDLALYQSILERMKHGESYYPIVTDELRKGGYALRPVLNFRLPTLASMLSVLPAWTALALLRGLAATVVIAWVARFRKAGASLPRAAALGAVVFTGVALAFADAALVWHEAWAGLLVALALAVHGERSWGYSVALGLCAALIRELALPLPLVMMALAVRERRFAEAGAWLGVIAIFGAALSAHWYFATQQLVAADPSNSWGGMGGWGFLVSTVRWNILLTTAPFWLNALVLAVAMFGIAGWSDRLGGRIALLFGAWLAAFMIVGRPDNHYWGLMYAPLLSLGVALALPSLLVLIRSANLTGPLTARARS